MSTDGAGPSQLRRNGYTNGDTQPSSTNRRRKRPSGLEDMFERQDLEEKKQLSRDYRALQTQADDMRTNIQNVDPAALLAGFERQDQLFRTVLDPAIAVLDAKLIQTTTETAAGLARNMRLDANAFDVDEFLSRIRNRLAIGMDIDDATSSDVDELVADSHEATQRERSRRTRRQGDIGNWEKIGWIAAGLNRRVTGVEFMLGPLSVEHKKRVVAPRKKNKPLAPVVTAEVIELAGKTNKNDTVSNVREVGKTLQRLDPERKGLNLFKTLINPESFGQTVENFFGMSFLIKDGRARINVEDDGEVMIRAEDPFDGELDGDEEVEMNQAIIELDMETWREAIKIFNITEAAVPHRKDPQGVPATTGAWYT